MEVPSYQPKSLAELDRILQTVNLPVTYVAGGTDIMIHEQHWKSARCLVSLESVGEMRNTLRFEESGVLVGASLPLSDIIENKQMQQRFPMLVEACRQIGSVQIQNRATMGGNIANASPAGDTLPVLSVLEAELWIGPQQQREFRKMKLEEVMLGPGLTSLKNNRYIAYIYLPLPESQNLFWYFRKVGPRYSMAISKLSLAVLGWIQSNRLTGIRICAGSVSPQIKRARRTEELLRGRPLSKEIIEKAAAQLQEEIAPISDIRSSSTYRRQIAGALLMEALTRMIERKSAAEF
jgi:CO/xanthine dehydrogenase FAD-binding subunit